MATFKYDAVYAGGEKTSGVVEALSREEAIAKIRQSCEVVLSLKEVPKVVARTPGAKSGRVKAKSLALTCQQFAIILRTGLPLVQTVDLVAGQCDDKVFKNILQQVSEDVAGGWSLSYSFDQRGTKLPVTFKESIRAGEESGDLVSAFERMGHYYDRTAKTNAKAISTMTYPAFVLAVAVIVVGIIMVYAIPSFTNTFESMNIELPWVTKLLIGVSDFMVKYIALIIAFFVAVGMGITLYGKTEKGGLNLSRLLLSIPVIGEIGRMAGASQFSHTMAAMLASGMPIIQAIEVSGRSMTNLIMAHEIQETIPGVESGHSLGSCMANAKELPAMLVQMTAIGESSGALESTLLVLADYYDNEVSIKTDRAMSLLEPIIICVLGGLVVMILFAIYLPMFTINSAI